MSGWRDVRRASGRKNIIGNSGCGWFLDERSTASDNQELSSIADPRRLMDRHASDPVSHLLELHAVEQLRGYIGNLSAVTHAVQNNWVPAHDDPGVAGLLDILRQYLTNTGEHEDDLFLLRYGLTVPGTQRGIVPPLEALTENRGGFSSRRQSEAEGQIRRLRDALAIGRFLRSDLDGDTQRAILELALICNRLRGAGDSELLHFFRQLSDVQAEQLAAAALRCVDDDSEPLVDTGTQILQRLSAFRDAGLTEATCDALMARNVFWPSSLYRDAGESVASRLVGLIDMGPEELALNHLLLALAWTRSEGALRAFRSWSNRAPRWSKTLLVPVEEYLPSAGWCLDKAGNRRDLISRDCFRLVGPLDSSAANVTCRKALSDMCPSCGGPQGVLFDFTEANESRLTGTFAEAPRRVLCCLHCSCYRCVFTRYNPDGTTDWLSPVEPSEFAYGEGGSPEPCYRTLEASPTSPFADSQPFGLEDASTLGGIPMWLQDAEFPRCIDCGRLMVFLAQHDNGPLGEEGIYYAFFCAECRVAGVTYQQT